MSLAESELVRLELEIERLKSELGRLRVAVGDGMPRVGPRDSLRVARLKEDLARLMRERSRAGTRVEDRAGNADRPDRLH